MFAGVLTKRNATGLWRVLYLQVRSRPERFSEQCLHNSQGLSWVFIASLSETLPTVCALFFFRSVRSVMSGLTGI